MKEGAVAETWSVQHLHGRLA